MTHWKDHLLKASRALGDASMTPKTERKRGRRAREGVVGSSMRSVDAEVEAYVDSVGWRLVSASRDRLPPGITPNFTLIRSGKVTAFCAQGGQIFVTLGLVNSMNSEAELAAVLAHELGHMVSRHGVQSEVLDARLKKVGRHVARGLGGGETARTATNFGRKVATRSIGRLQEEEADRIGLEMLAAAGYAPAAAAEVLTRIGGDDAARSPIDRVLATHPPTADRAARLRTQARSAPNRRAGRIVGVEMMRQVKEGLRRRESRRRTGETILRVAPALFYIALAIAWAVS